MNFRDFIISEANKVDIIDLSYRYLLGKLDQESFNLAAREFFVTRGGEYDNYMRNFKNNPQLMKNWSAWYRNTLEKITANIVGKGWKASSNPVWQGYEAPNKAINKIDNKTFKRYYTIDFDHLTKFLPYLSQLVDSLSTINTKSSISFKVPAAFPTFFTERDTLVIHFYDPSISEQVNQVTIGFLNKIGIKPANRKSFFGASDTGVDISGQSDTKLIASRIARNLDANKQALLNMDRQNFTQAVQGIWQRISSEASHRN